MAQRRTRSVLAPAKHRRYARRRSVHARGDTGSIFALSPWRPPTFDFIQTGIAGLPVGFRKCLAKVFAEFLLPALNGAAQVAHVFGNSRAAAITSAGSLASERFFDQRFPANHVGGG
jgi:hypothetical protein